MTLRRKIGIAFAVTGILINVAHFVLFFFSDEREKYHGHELVIIFGIALVLIGVSMTAGNKQER